MSADARRRSHPGRCSKRYGDTVALDGLDLDAEPGEILGVAGPNGAGKSTMVKILAGEVGWDEGEIVVDGEPWSPVIGARPRRGRPPGAAALPEPDRRARTSCGPRAQRLALAEAGRRAARAARGARRSSTLADRQLGSSARSRSSSAPRSPARSRSDARVMLFDEPNSALTAEESEEFFRLHHASSPTRAAP